MQEVIETLDTNTSSVVINERVLIERLYDHIIVQIYKNHNDQPQKRGFALSKDHCIDDAARHAVDLLPSDI
jgi:hypothetical protein